MPSTVVVGLAWGDEAKGKVVDYVSQKANLVVRFNGGNNAGHTVVLEDPLGRGENVFKFHTLPVGALNKGVTSIIADGVVVDPKVLSEELTSLASRGFYQIDLKISGNAHVIMPYHKVLDGLLEELKGDKKIGTTGRGIGPCYQDKVARTGIRMSQLVDPEQFPNRLYEVWNPMATIFTTLGGNPLECKYADILSEYERYARRLAPYVTNTASIVFEAASTGKKIVFEGAHGTLLDIDHGTYPYVSSSHSVSGGACIGTGIGPRMINDVIGVAKAYTTRVGEGWFPTELKDEIGNKIREHGHEYGTTTGRPRRCGWFDAVLVRHAIQVNSASAMALMCLDVLSGLKTIRVCTGYRLGKKLINDFPTDSAILAECRPEYENFPGWEEDISAVRTFEDLPSCARKYVLDIQDRVGISVAMISVGPRRDQTIVVQPELLGV